ncbi:MAG TPA: extracellular solute-binding protein [Phycisphaerae bacterium]|nr:extracellular solute-binding protein [Phycisphaerae bacterium]
MRSGRRWLVITHLAALALLSGALRAGEQTVSFRAWGLPVASRTDVTAVADREVLREFYKRFPQYDIEPFTMPQVGGSSMDTGPLMAVAAGVAPHAMYVNFRQSSTYIEQAFLEPLEVLLARVLADDERLRQADSAGRWLADPTQDQIDRALELIRQRVPKPAWPVVCREDESGRLPGKHVWAIPTSTVVMALMYRKDLFAKAGLDPDRAPATWDELLEYARKLTVPAKRQVGMIIPSGQGISWGVYTFLVSNGGRAVEKDPNTGQWRAVYDSREAAEALAFLWRLVREPFEKDGQTIRGCVTLGTVDDRTIRWERGEVGMIFSYLYEELIGRVNPQLIGVAPVPLSHRGTRGSELNCAMLGVFSQSSPAQKIGVMRYLWFRTGKEAQGVRTRVYVENGYGRLVNPDLLKEFGYQHILRQVPAGWKEAFEEAMQNGVPEPYGRNTQYIYRFMSEPINASLELDLSSMGREEGLRRIQALLAESVHDVNVKAMGNLPESVMRVRRILAVVVIAVVAMAFGLGMLHIWRYFTKAGAGLMGKPNWHRVIWGYVLLAPALAMVIWWAYGPLGAGLSLSFIDFQFVRDSTWVGVDNFATVLFDAKFWASLARTFYFVALIIGLGFWPPILLAILLQEVPTSAAKYVFRTIYYLPALVSGVIVMFLWRQLYDPTEYGTLNKILLSVNTLGPVAATALKWVVLAVWLALIFLVVSLPIRVREMSRPLKAGLWALGALLLGATLLPVVSAGLSGGPAGAGATLSSLVGRFELKPLRWIESPEMAMLCVVIPAVWAGSGPGCILYLAALKTVPEELYEAADIDGASNWHKVFYIVIPRLKYLITIQFIAAVVGAFKGGTDMILALTGGGPNNATSILALEIFFRTFLDLRFGIGTAMAWILGAMLIGFTAAQLKMLSRAEFRAAGGTPK